MIMSDERVNIVAEKVTFYHFSNFLHKLNNLPNLERKRGYLREFIREWRRVGRESIKDRTIHVNLQDA